MDLLGRLVVSLALPQSFSESSHSLCHRVVRWSSHPFPLLFTALFVGIVVAKNCVVLRLDKRQKQGVPMEHFTKGVVR